ncbi:pH-response regulator protein palH/RIM21 [Histoplasma capsulatum G186AR]|uniref:PH-response regulator protein palH/RIM21 n=2 Tax=Ajellomyces capsulatus TaxID=5037 RepID=C0NF95_AJECG|nr:pH-response regulator protein palH/RIM21 [Histoplasma capsulatum G186AR]EEH09916.1 pH-response regulator protein palH/RIM21 [Histoplasma capsulatum G186AR]KAG5298937.1 pH-response regulator protein palH/RIM21 [Histoplasma capsulatum]QSS73069.1 pH-response regulator protein palH/RIM21 [Histoplasma capsulatum G186AR]
MSFVGWLLSRNESDRSHSVCPGTTLGKGGTILVNDTFIITLAENAIFRPACTNVPVIDVDNPTSIADIDEPFYASTSPQMYVIATATVISYLLVIILFITPRTFFVGGRGGGSFLGRRGRLGGSYGSSSVIGIGGRPWLQKVAATTTAISLSIATADSFRVAKEQYDRGYMDSSALTAEVIGGVEIRVVRVISSTFLWLAQVQTLIRLFPRHKEKVIIKWTGFALIVLDVIFSILNSFISRSLNPSRPRNIVEAIPALNYLFELSLSLLYAAWVIFYCLSKHRFAFFHPKMRNICLVALLSLVSVVIPIVFFVLDLSKPNVAGWGEYIRWVGAAAASVVVWEWVERIEALERDERKDGILGREIFDGDEMLEVTPSQEVDWPGSHNDKYDGGGNEGSGSGWGGVIGLTHRPLKTRVTFQSRLPQARRKTRKTTTTTTPAANGTSTNGGDDVNSTPPPNTTTPVSRTDTVSAASTVYRVRYHSVGSVTSDGMERAPDEEIPKEFPAPTHPQSTISRDFCSHSPPIPVMNSGLGWIVLNNPFKKRRGSPPTQVATAQAKVTHTLQSGSETANGDGTNDKTWNFKSKLDTIFTYRPWDKGKLSRETDPEAPLPVTVIPAPRSAPRGQSPSRDDGEQDTSTQDQRDIRSNSDLPVMVIPPPSRSSRTWPLPVVEPSSQAGERRNESLERPFVGDGASPRPRKQTDTVHVGDSNELRTSAATLASEATLSSPIPIHPVSPNSTSSAQGHRSDTSIHPHYWGGGLGRRISPTSEVPILIEEEHAIIQVVREQSSSSSFDDGNGSDSTSPAIEISPDGERYPHTTTNSTEPVPQSSSSGSPTAHSRHISFLHPLHDRDNPRHLTDSDLGAQHGN